MSNTSIVVDTKTLVPDSLSGLVYANPALRADLGNKVVYRAHVAQDQVHIVSGGGAGHEPAHAAFVGEGMLSAAVSGQTFASPNSRQVSSALDRLAGGKGILVVIKNYTGDGFQFALAKERFSAANPGKHIRMVIVGDDVAVGRAQGAIVGRRGLAGTVLVYKLSGALAAQGANLNEVHAVAQHVADNAVTIGVGLDHCQIPGNTRQPSHLSKDEVEIGMGIHNEPGAKLSKFTSTKDLIAELMHNLTDQTDLDRKFVDFAMDGTDNVILLVNNLGGISELEMGVALKLAGHWCKEKKINVKRAVSGTFMTSLNMPGLSISLVKLPSKPATVQGYSISANHLIDLFDAQSAVPSWKNSPKAEPNQAILSGNDGQAKANAQSNAVHKGPTPDSKVFLSAVTEACKSVIEAEPELTKYDSILGDGDCGLTLKGGGEAVIAKIQEGALSGNLTSSLVAISEVAEVQMGGTSGVLFSIFFNKLAAEFAQIDEEAEVDAKMWSDALGQSLDALYAVTRARPPNSRTLIDPLAAFITTFHDNPSDLSAAYKAAQKAQEATATMEAKAGRSAYIDKDKVASSNIPDAGATGVVRLMDGMMKIML